MKSPPNTIIQNNVGPVRDPASPSSIIDGNLRTKKAFT